MDKKMKKELFIALFFTYELLAIDKTYIFNLIQENNITIGQNIDYSGYVPRPPNETIFYSSEELNISHFYDIFDDIEAISLYNITKLDNNVIYLFTLIDRLDSLYISDSTLTSFPKIDKLKKLYLTRVKPNIADSEIFKNTTLITLNINECNLTNISENISKLTELTTLAITKNRELKNLTNTIVNLKKLDKLDLSSNSFTEFPKEIFEIESLTKVKLTDNKLKDLSGDSNISNIYYLDLAHNSFENLPKHIYDLNLTYLNLSFNHLKQLRDDIKNLKSWENLNLSYNQIETISDRITNPDILSMKARLDLSNNRLKKLPDSFSKLFNVSYFDLSNNNLEELPKDFFAMFSKGEFSFVSYDDIWSGYIGGISNIGKYLDISDNRISYINFEICDNKSFVFLNIENNFLEYMPSCLQDSTSEYQGISLYSFLKEIYSANEYNLSINKRFDERNKISLEPIFGRDINVSSYLWSYDNINSSEVNLTIFYEKDINITLSINDGEINTTVEILDKDRVLELKSGWNMITPITKNDINTTLFNQVWSYKNGEWNNTIENLTPSNGYWLKLESDINYSSIGYPYKTPKSNIDSNKWNFIGSGKSFDRDSNRTIFQYIDSKWVFNPNSVDAGRGFWIK